MKQKQEIKNFIPEDEQEIADKEYMLNFMNCFEDVLTRDNIFGHFTSSACVLNETRDKVLLVHHNIFESWMWPGGHVDGESNFLEVAIRETREETGVENIKVLQNEIFAIENYPILGHEKRGKYVSSHTHLDVIYLLEVSEKEVLKIKPDENTGVKWVPISELQENVSYLFANHMCPKMKRKLEKWKI